MKLVSWVGSVAVALVFGLAACGDGATGPGDAPGAVASVSISPETVEIAALGSTVPLTATARDADGAVVSGAAADWSTVGSGVVEIDPVTGLLTALANGTETVRATVDGVTGMLSVTVEQVPVELDLSGASTSFTRVGASTVLQSVARDANGNAVIGSGAVSFVSSDPSVVHVDDGGTVTANGPGTAEITAEAGSLSETATFTVSIMGSAGGPVLGGEVPCAAGTAAEFPCGGVDLLSYLPLAGLGATPNVKLNDMWGWSDAATSRQYALVGRTDGVTFVDVTDPLEPRALGHLPSAAPPATWRDVKVYADHAYVVADGSPGHGVQIFDLTRLRDEAVYTTFTEDGRYTGVSSVHNIAINEATGFAYAVGSQAGGMTCGGGLHMIDLSDATSPSFAGCFSDATTGRSLTGYTHDVQCVLYDGPDADYAGREICIGSNETALSIADVTDKQNPIAVSTATYPDARYVHQGWLTEDQAYFVQNDELDELNGVVANTRMLVWDVSDLDDPILVREHFGPTGAVDHNMYVRGDLLYHSNYHYGLRVIDISDPTSPVERGFFDTHPPNNFRGFDGSWSNYPWFADGVVAVTSATEGLFLLRVQP